MKNLIILLKIVKRLIILVVFSTLIIEVFASALTGRLLNSLMRVFSLHLVGGDTLGNLLMIAASILALVTLITPSYWLYVITSVATFLARTPDTIWLSLVILGLVSLLVIDTYSTCVSRKKNVKASVKGSRVYYLVIFTVFAVTVVLITHLITLYLNLFTSFMTSVPATSPVRAFSLFLSDNPIGRVLLILVAVSVFVKLSLNLIDAVTYFVIPSSTLAKSELSTSVKYDVEIKYPFYTLMSLIFTLYMAPPLYYLLNYLTVRVLPWSSSFLGDFMRSSPYATYLPTLAEILFFLVLWGLLSYVTRFFRGHINNKLVAVFVFLVVLFLIVTQFSSLDMNEFLSVVYFKYYKDFLVVGELLLQITGFVP
ncbi:MAG: hypothetical protein QXN90_00395 [Zestosphaera sp.]